LKILCCGDVHIGRRSSRLPAHVDGRLVSCGACWERVVDCALAERVDVVALSGDVIDRENRYYEAIGPLEAGIERLADAGIVTVAVAGNHDHDVLPRVAEALGPERLRLLGLGGRWERTSIRRGDEAVEVMGWSFPEAVVRSSPLASLELERGELPVLGLLHADLDQPVSDYAPVSLAELRAAPVDFWLLGHVHAPRLDDAGAPPILYPGSPQAMDPGEPGVHGVWILELGRGRAVRLRQVPLSTVRYDSLELDVDGVADAGEFDRRVTAAVREHLARVAESAGPLRYLSLRLRITGRTPLHRSLESRVALLQQDLELENGEVTAVVERVEPETRPARDLEELARGADPVGVLARLLLSLDRDGHAEGAAQEDVAELLREAARVVNAVFEAKPYLSLPREDVDTAAVAARVLARQASLLLDELLARKEGV